MNDKTNGSPKTMLTREQVRQLISSYKRTQKMVTDAQQQMEERINAALNNDATDFDRVISKLEESKALIAEILQPYTDGFRSFSRSVAKSKQANKPDQDFMDKVHDIRMEADGMLEHLNWMIDRFHKEAEFSKMFSGTAPIGTAPFPDVAPDGRSEDKAGSEPQEGNGSLLDTA